ncbi:MAG: non-canonical purine NTP pyrophosphatase, partial [Ignavibacteria bacterium]
MNKILLATNNKNKISEINSILKDIPGLQILPVHYFGIAPEIAEDRNTIEENAYKKAQSIYNIFRIPAVSDDTGLFVDALKGEPG